MQYQSSSVPKLAGKCGIKHWLPCGADGRAAGGRAVYGHVITKFSGMGRFTYPWCSASVLHAPELRYQHRLDHASKSPANCNQRGGNSRKAFLIFKAEKRSAQASAHPLSQAQGGLFCVLTVFQIVCCWSSEWSAPVRKLAPCKAFLFDMIALFSSLENYFGFRTTNVRRKNGSLRQSEVE